MAIRVKQAVLLKERWKLIKSGVDRKDIKINRDKLLVRGSTFGSLDPADNTKFIKVSSDESGIQEELSALTTATDLSLQHTSSPQLSTIDDDQQS